MAAEEISATKYALGKKDGVLDWFFKSGSYCFLDSENRKFSRTLRIGSKVLIKFLRKIVSISSIILKTFAEF